MNHIYLFSSEYFKFRIIDNKLIVDIDEFEILNEDSKMKAFEKELRLKTKV